MVQQGQERVALKRKQQWRCGFSEFPKNCHSCMLSVFPDVEDVYFMQKVLWGMSSFLSWASLCNSLEKKVSNIQPQPRCTEYITQTLSIILGYFSLLNAWRIYYIVIHELKTSEKVQDFYISPYFFPPSLSSLSKRLLAHQQHLPFLFSATLWAPYHQLTWQKSNSLVPAAAEEISEKFNWEYTGLFLLKYFYCFFFECSTLLENWGCPAVYTARMGFKTPRFILCDRTGYSYTLIHMLDLFQFISISQPVYWTPPGNWLVYSTCY